MSDSNTSNMVSEHVKTLDVIHKFCYAAHGLIDAKKMPLVHTAMLALLIEIDKELEKVKESGRVSFSLSSYRPREGNL